MLTVSVLKAPPLGGAKSIRLGSLTRFVRLELPVRFQVLLTRVIFDVLPASVNAAPVKVEDVAVRLRVALLTACTTAAPPLSDDPLNVEFKVVSLTLIPAPNREVSVLLSTTRVPAPRSKGVESTALAPTPRAVIVLSLSVKTLPPRTLAPCASLPVVVMTTPLAVNEAPPWAVGSATAFGSPGSSISKGSSGFVNSGARLMGLTNKPTA
ncbi:hypothetical protein D3C81_1272110 [compost metagenome]